MIDILKNPNCKNNINTFSCFCCRLILIYEIQRPIKKTTNGTYFL